MATRKQRTLTAAGVTRETLELTPGKALQFLLGVGARPPIRTVLEQRGFDDEERKRGWKLLEEVGNHSLDETEVDPAVSAAIAEIDAWDEPNIRLIRAAFTRYPGVADTVLRGITPTVGPAAILNVARILERLDGLEGTTEGDAALTTLGVRGLPKAERKRIAGLVKIAKSAQKAGASEAESNDQAYLQGLLALREWYEEWSEIARLVVTRRDHLIRLGLATRRTTDASPAADDADVIVDPTPFIDASDEDATPNKD